MGRRESFMDGEFYAKLMILVLACVLGIAYALWKIFGPAGPAIWIASLVGVSVARSWDRKGSPVLPEDIVSVEYGR